MRPLSDEALREVENLVAEGDLDPEARLAHAAELIALRKLHRLCAEEKRGSLRFIRLFESLPRMVGDLSAWKRQVAEARARLASESNGALDLVTTTKRT